MLGIHVGIKGDMVLRNIIKKAYGNRFKLLNGLGVLIGATAWSGISSYTHIVPKWLLVCWSLQLVMEYLSF